MHSSLIYYCHSPAIREWQRTSLRAHSARTHTRRERKAYTHTQSAFIWRDGNTSGQPFIEIYRETTNECEEKTVTHRVYKQIDKTNNKWCPWECHLLWAQLTSLPVTRIGCDQIGFVYLVENRHNVSPPHTHPVKSMRHQFETIDSHFIPAISRFPSLALSIDRLSFLYHRLCRLLWPFKSLILFPFRTQSH